MINKKDKMQLMFNRNEYRVLFMQHYNITEQDMEVFWKAFMDFGMSDTTRNSSHTTAAHYYFQGIVEHLSLNWCDYGRRMPEDVQKWMKEKYPALIGITDIAPSTI